MVYIERENSPEDGFIAEIKALLDSQTAPFDVTAIVNKYIESSTLVILNNALRFCCSKGFNRPSIIATDGGKKYTLINH